MPGCENTVSVFQCYEAVITETLFSQATPTGVTLGIVCCGSRLSIGLDTSCLRDEMHQNGTVNLGLFDLCLQDF